MQHRVRVQCLKTTAGSSHCSRELIPVDQCQQTRMIVGPMVPILTLWGLSCIAELGNRRPNCIIYHLSVYHCLSLSIIVSSHLIN